VERLLVDQRQNLRYGSRELPGYQMGSGSATSSPVHDGSGATTADQMIGLYAPGYQGLGYTAFPTTASASLSLDEGSDVFVGCLDPARRTCRGARTLGQEVTSKFANKLKHYHPGLRPTIHAAVEPVKRVIRKRTSGSRMRIPQSLQSKSSATAAQAIREENQIYVHDVEDKDRFLPGPEASNRGTSALSGASRRVQGQAQQENKPTHGSNLQG